MAIKEQAITWACDQCGKTETHTDVPKMGGHASTGYEQPFGNQPFGWFAVEQSYPPSYTAHHTFCSIECLAVWAKQ